MMAAAAHLLEMKSLTLLGSTGSIGANTLDVVRHNRNLYRVYALAAGHNVDAILQQIIEFRPEVAVLATSEGIARLAAGLSDSGQFSFNPSPLQNPPGYQFQLQQGNRGVSAGRAAAGLSGSGAAAKALGTFDQGLAGTTYNQQYQNALSGYQTNANTNLAQAGLGLNASNSASTAARRVGPD